MEEVKKEILRKILDRIYEVGDDDLVIIAGDLNVHVGNDCKGYEDVMGKFGVERIFCTFVCIQNNLKVCNTLVQEKGTFDNI